MKNSQTLHIVSLGKQCLLSALLPAVLCLAGCEAKYPTDDNLRGGVARVADYLYDSLYYDYSAEAALRLTRQGGLLLGGSSAVHNGQYVGRNYDGVFDTSVEFIIRVPHTEDRLASVGMAGGIPAFTAQMVEKGEESVFYDALPYLTLDGVNECGVFCGICMLPFIDITPTDNTLPGAESLTFRMVPRYVLDNAVSAADAVELLSGISIAGSEAHDCEAHFMIADSTATYVVEWVDGRMAVADSLHVLTNFYLLRPMTPHSRGIERYNLAEKNYSTGSDLAGMTKLMHTLRQSRMYDRSVSPFWYSDYNGDKSADGFGDLTVESLPEDYEKCIKTALKNYRKQKRDYTLDIRHTKHTGIYDLSACSVIYYVQEDYSRYFEYQVER